MNDLLVLVLFWGLLMGPCAMAFQTGMHRDDPRPGGECPGRG